MANLGPISRAALESALTKPIPDRLLVCVKVINDCERARQEVSRRLCRDLRAVLTPILKDPESTGEQITRARDLLGRVGKFDPRRKANQEPTEKPADAVVVNAPKVEEPQPVGPDGLTYGQRLKLELESRD